LQTAEKGKAKTQDCFRIGGLFLKQHSPLSAEKDGHFDFSNSPSSAACAPTFPHLYFTAPMRFRQGARLTFFRIMVE